MFICYTSVLEEEDVEYQITLIFELRVNSFGDPSAALHQGETQGIYVRFSVYFKFFTSRTKIGLEYEIKNGARIYEAHENHWADNLWLQQRIATQRIPVDSTISTAVAVSS